MNYDNDNSEPKVTAPIEKTCTKCSVTKPLSEFYKRDGGKYGVRADCKKCCNERSRLYHQEYYPKNIEKERARQATYRSDHPDRTRESSKKWRKKNPGVWKKRYWKDHEKTLLKAAASRDKNRERNRGYARAWIRSYRATAKGHLETSIRSGVYKGITKGAKAGRSTFELLGYTLDKLMRHIEKQFEPGMSWENYGRNGWHIDHKIPLSVHNYSTPDDPDFKRAWALKNLRPMWEPENISKGAKLDAEFQPSLAMPLPTNDNVRTKRTKACR